MINELICYKCKCDKCGHGWTTKSHTIPRVCSKCHSVKWNEGSAPAVPLITPVESPLASEPIDAPQSDRKDVLNALQAKIDAIQNGEVKANEPVDEWTGWTSEQQTYDDQTGEMRTFRRHIKTNKVKWLDAETWFG